MLGTRGTSVRRCPLKSSYLTVARPGRCLPIIKSDPDEGHRAPQRGRRPSPGPGPGGGRARPRALRRPSGWTRRSAQVPGPGPARRGACRRPSDADVVVMGGGDGTMSAGAGGLAGTGKPMGVLPLGTLNHFARDLGIPTELEEAVRNVVRGRGARGGRRRGQRPRVREQLLDRPLPGRRLAARRLDGAAEHAQVGRHGPRRPRHPAPVSRRAPDPAPAGRRR